jgi:hypothetical protein
MSTTAWKGPLIAFGQGAPSGGGLGQASDPSGSRSPSLFDQGLGIMDPRAPFTYQPGAVMGGTAIGDRGAYGWWGTTKIAICNQVPSTISATAIAAAQVPVAATALTLVSTTGGGITVGASVVNASTGATVTGLLAIDGAMTPVQNGTTGGNLFWDPTKAIARAVQITSVGDDHLATATVAGYDVYGYPMTETITLTNGSVATGKKAFKYLASITPAGTLSGSNVSVGQSDVIGFMLRSDLFQYLEIYWPDTTLIAANTGYTAAVTTDPATATTGDVRGTYALQGSASNNTRRLVIFINLPLANIGTAAGLVGVTQA